MRAFLPYLVVVGPLSLAAFACLAFGACSAEHSDAAPTPALDSGFVDASDSGPVIDSAIDDVPAFDVPSETTPDTAPPPDPKTCDEAVSTRSYIGCDFWPTTLANRVWSIFDFAAIVANAGDTEARITVTGPGGFKKEAIVGPNRVTKLYLPWNAALKGPDGDACGSAGALDSSIRSNKGAYHLVTTRPVAVYQFNALEFKGEGGPPTKSWTGCPGDSACTMADGTFVGPLGCFSFTNDASLLLPTTAMTGNYRVTSGHGAPGANPYFAITATQDGTEIDVTMGSHGRILPGDVDSGIPFTGPGKHAKFKLDAGDVVELMGGAFSSSDPSGSLVQATKPVQVISGVPCIEQPIGTPACDHIEQTVFPAETLGKDYVVTVPTAPAGDVIGHVVRIFGNIDGTHLSYFPKAPKGAPTTMNAGEVFDLGIVTDDFEVTADNSFAVGSFMLGGEVLDPSALVGEQKGDPSQSNVIAVEQYRLKYVFLAPDDYPVSFIDVVSGKDATLTLDGTVVADLPKAIGATGFVVHRLLLGAGEVGAHLLTSTKPVGMQVMGYARYTSYQYPGGLNLATIAPPPPK